ncbi:WD domain, G-beta repeat domain-containing protein [Plasmodium vivax North Korean]|uniref:WD domain, G-beta repeat domain-containing protein n=1 Tax=Plasmodium vivax North Korean TaxID=1035514 RepID=A0A0J9WEH5_PLAVI|nr:WD domain, G-beta repeat domain-containing protein [Plasmodium vivax North Korean]
MEDDAGKNPNGGPADLSGQSDNVVGDDEYPEEFSESGESNEFSEGGKEERYGGREDRCETPHASNLQPERESKLPFAKMKEEVLHVHKKNISGVKTVRKGSSLILTGNDNCIRVYEFQSMNREDKSCSKLITLAEGSTIQSVDATSNLLLVANGNKSFVYDRTGKLVKNTIRGDMYITDANKTKGHTRSVNCCRFHPCNESIFASASLDSTVRIWDLEKNNCYGIDKELVHHQCIKVVNEKNMMQNNVLCCQFVRDGNSIILGCENGQIEVRNKISNDYMFSYKPKQHIGRDLSHSDSIVDILTCKKRDHFFFTRSLDNTVKYWDRRNLQRCVKSIEGIPTIFKNSSMSLWGADERYLVLGTQERKEVPTDEVALKGRAVGDPGGSTPHGKEHFPQELKRKGADLYANNYVKVYQGDEDMEQFLNQVAASNKTVKCIKGALQIYDTYGEVFSLVHERRYEEAGIICTHFSDHIGQLFLGTTDGNCLVYYHDERSGDEQRSGVEERSGDDLYGDADRCGVPPVGRKKKGGVLEYLHKGVKRKRERASFYTNSEHIYNLDSLPKEIKITDAGDVLIKKDLINAKVKMNPKLSSFTANAYEKKRQVGMYSKYIVDANPSGKDPSSSQTNKGNEYEEEDIVEKLRKREQSKQGGDYFMNAYKYTQPSAIIDYSSGEEQEYSQLLKKPKCPQCGVKNCVCGFMRSGGRRAR